MLHGEVNDALVRDKKTKNLKCEVHRIESILLEVINADELNEVSEYYQVRYWGVCRGFKGQGGTG